MQTAKARAPNPLHHTDNENISPDVRQKLVESLQEQEKNERRVFSNSINKSRKHLRVLSSRDIQLKKKLRSMKQYAFRRVVSHTSLPQLLSIVPTDSQAVGPLPKLLCFVSALGFFLFKSRLGTGHDRG